MKKSFKFFLAGFLVIAGLGAGIKVSANYSAHNDFTSFFTIKGIGTLTNTAIAWIDGTYRSLHLYDGDIILGAKGNKPSTTSGEYPGLKVQLKNCGSAAWTVGGLITVDDDEAGCGTMSPTTQDLTDWIGIAESATAVGSVGYVTIGGYALALTTGTVNRGDVLVSTAAASGYLGADATPTTGADVGVALSSGTAAGGLTIIRLR